MLLAVVVALLGYGCEANYFNEHNLPGYENSGEITDVKELALTLTADDYAAIAKNAQSIIDNAAAISANTPFQYISENEILRKPFTVLYVEISGEFALSHSPMAFPVFSGVVFETLRSGNTTRV